MAFDPTYELAQSVGAAAIKSGLRIAAAESCTGGGLAHAITAVPGSSRWFDRGFVTYSNAAKQEMLGVGDVTLARFGAVSEQTAREMAEGALRHSPADISIAITGIAGPDGGTAEKPVGTVCVAWVWRNRTLLSTRVVFDGDRQAIRRQAVMLALKGVLGLLESSSA